MSKTPTIQKAGSVDVRTLELVSSNGSSIPLNEFLIEFNLYEDMFASTMYGEVFISDSRNLIDKLPIIGEEQLLVDIITPDFKDQYKIKKAFRVYKISDRKVIRDNNTQTYILHFASNELFKDLITPIFSQFNAEVSGIASSAFDSIKTDRYPGLGPTGLQGVGVALNKIKFISPGWTPIKIINWAATKALPLENDACNFVFYESNKKFYFANITRIFQSFHTKDGLFGSILNFVGSYSYSPTNIDKKSTSVVDEFYKVKELNMENLADNVKNSTSGYLGNRIIVLDVFNKEYSNSVFNYISKYKEYYHTSGKGSAAVPIFSSGATASVNSSISYYPYNPNLYGGPDGNNVLPSINPKQFQSRRSLLMDVSNLKLNIVVAGRTDVEVGNMLYLKFPELGPASEEDYAKEKLDKRYSGYYLITAIHHKITFIEHIMFLEIVKDSLRFEE